MITLRFIPIFEDKVFMKAAEEYQKIWAEYGENIINAFNKITTLSFVEDRIAVVVYEEMSMSGRFKGDVMKLRASYDFDEKKGTLVHELGHRLIGPLLNRKDDVDEHQTLFLFLYDVWIELWGKEFADKMVEAESKRKGHYDYENAWKWALLIPLEKRSELFFEIKNLNQ